MPAVRPQTIVGLLVMILFGFNAVSPALAHSPSSSTGQAVAQAARALGQKLTTDLVRLNTQYQLAASESKPKLAQGLLNAAIAREQKLLDLMDLDPGEVLRLAVPGRVRAGLPTSVQAYIEQDVDIDGTFEVLHADNATGGGEYVYHLRTTAGRFSLHFAGDAPDLPTGTRVRAHGVRVQNAVALEGESAIVPVTSVPTSTFGEQRVLVIPVYFTDKAQAVYNYADIMSKVDAYYRNNTYGRTWMTSTITPPLLIGMSYTVCDYWKVATLARSAAQAAGYDLTKYNRHVLAHPKTACTWSGLGTVGGNPSTAWLNGIFPQSTVGHELGHNVGAYHSHSLACTGSTCSASEYGDGYDIMGTSSSLGHFNAFQKERLGWLNYPPQSTPPVLTVYGSGQYTIDAYELVGTAPKALKILKSTDPATGKKTWYYVEARSSGTVLLHSGSESSANTSYLWDLLQDTSSIDWVLNAGQSYTDPAAATTIAAVSAGATGATVKVTIGSLPCVRDYPAQAVTPAVTQWISAGAVTTYTTTVTNQDTSACSGSTFAVGTTVPAGWAAVVSPTSLTLAPGASGSATITVYSAPTAPPGLYTYPVTATNGAASAYTESTSVTTMVVGSLTVALLFDKNPPVYRNNQWAMLTTFVGAADASGKVVGAAGVSVTLTIKNPAGATSTVTGITDAAGKLVYSYRVKAKDPAGTWQVTAGATKSGVSGTASGFFTVQ